MPCREYPMSFVPDVDGRVLVPIMHHTTPTDPMAIRERERVVDRAAGVTPFRRRKEATDHDEVSAMPEAFVFQLPLELAETGIRETLGQLGSRKAGERQILGTHRVMAGDDLGTQFVLEV